MLTFQELYETYAEDVYRFAYWLTGERYEAEDITSETFVRAWVHHSPIRTETLKAYLFTIARNVYLGQQRKSKRQVELDDVYPSPEPEPDRVMEMQHDLVNIRSVLGTLPEIDRAAFVLRIQHELPYAEIARVLDLSLPATKVKVHRVRRKLFQACAEKEAY
ncbi:MAG: RNA polymerase sigma factor [Fidelibacterota bacterium]|nr:MAG: RNA polymerase sigma factor [Candidatus Neomarinimicrobiota bacterium]